MRRRTATRILLGAMAAGAIGVGVPATEAHADGLSKCQDTVGLWLFKGTHRLICDGVRREDGSWLRLREFYTPAHQVPLRTSCYGSSYVSCTTTGGYWQPLVSNGQETYVVYDSNVLPDEPGHLE